MGKNRSGGVWRRQRTQGMFEGSSGRTKSSQRAQGGPKDDQGDVGELEEGKLEQRRESGVAEENWGMHISPFPGENFQHHGDLPGRVVGKWEQESCLDPGGCCPAA